MRMVVCLLLATALLLSLHLHAQTTTLSGTVGVSGTVWLGTVSACSERVFSMSVNASTTPWTGTSSGDCTHAGAPRTEDPASSGKFAAILDGNNDSVACGTDQDNLATGSFTVMAWVRIPAILGAAQVIINKSAIGSTNWSWRLIVADTTLNTLRFQLENTSDQLETWQAPVNEFSAYVGLPTYTHVAVKSTGCSDMDCADVQIYIDGAPVTTTLVADSAGTVRDDATYTMMHGVTNDTADLAGGIAGTEVYAESESDACVASRFAVGTP